MRGTGQTTKQLERLPTGGYFVVAHRAMADYTTSLARHLGREDIKVITVEQCLNPARFAGLRDFSFVVDHATDDIVRDRSRVNYDRFMRALEEMSYRAST